MSLCNQLLCGSRSFLNRRRWMTTIVARSRFRPDRAIPKSIKAKAAASEGSWPRSVVIGFFATMAVVVPYTTSWFLAQHVETRELISNLFQLDDSSWDPIRRRFGERDYAGDQDAYKFEDEPDCTIRQTHAAAVRRDQEQVTVKIISLTDGDGVGVGKGEISVMPASRLATSKTFAQHGRVALEFPDDEATQDENTSNEESQEELTPRRTSVPYQVYSCWYYHPDSIEDQKNPPTLSKRSISASELAAIETELAQLDNEVKQGRDMDDPYVQDRLRQLKADRRRLQWSRWFGM